METKSSESRLYLRVEDRLRQEVETGAFAFGEKLPDERSLAARFRVSRTTVRLAVAGLVDKKILVRTPGKYGVFVPSLEQQFTYLHILAFGLNCRYTSFVQHLIAATQQSAQAAGWRGCLHYAETIEEACDIVRDIDKDPMAIGGVVIGVTTSAEVQAITVDASIPWIMVGDFAEPTRTAPLVHHVIGDTYYLFERASQCLVDHGCRKPAMIAFGADAAWGRDAISAYRTTLDAAGIAPEDQQIINTADFRERRPQTIDENWRFNVQMMRRIFEHWHKTDRWPDCIVIDPDNIQMVEAAALQTPDAMNHLHDVRLVLPGTDDRALHTSQHRLTQWPASWLVCPLDKITELAVCRIEELHGNPRPPVRDYVRAVRVTEDDPREALNDESDMTDTRFVSTDSQGE